MVVSLKKVLRPHKTKVIQIIEWLLQKPETQAKMLSFTYQTMKNQIVKVHPQTIRHYQG